MKKNTYHSKYKIYLCIVYVIIIIILTVCSYRLFKQKYIPKNWEEVTTVEDYATITISKMSEKFAYNSKTKKEFHFVIEENENTGLWHTYIVCIDNNDYNKYKNIIDYTYERIKEKPNPIKVKGYPELITKNLKEVALKNITKFVPTTNEITITEDNFEIYLTNSYLDTTKQVQDQFNSFLFILLILDVIMVVILIYTLKDKSEEN